MKAVNAVRFSSAESFQCGSVLLSGANDEHVGEIAAGVEEIIGIGVDEIKRVERIDARPADAERIETNDPMSKLASADAGRSG